MDSRENKDLQSITVVIPAFKVKDHVLQVISSIGPEVKKIILVDDACPEKSGEYVQANIKDKRVEVIFHDVNLGVGGAVKTGYRRAAELKSDIVVKIDGDGQMDTSRITELISPIVKGVAHYTKGNRFFDVETVRAMPKIRIIGNLGLSFLTKLSSGYWRIFDPNNGFTAINGNRLMSIPLDKIDNGYFFESDMLFRLNLMGAIVKDVPMPAIYDSEKSSLRISRVLVEFPFKHTRNFQKRIIYSYYLRDFNLASLQLFFGFILGTFGMLFGGLTWVQAQRTEFATPTGTVVLIALSLLASLQLILSFFSFDMSNDNSNQESVLLPK